MQKMIVIAMGLMSLIAAGSLQARLGESPAEIRGRYGKPVKNLPPASSEISSYIFEKDNISVQVTFQGMNSAEETYRSMDGSALSQATVDQLLDANKGSAAWREISLNSNMPINPNEMDWERSDGEALAKCTKPGNVLTVVTKKYADSAYTQKQPATFNGSTKGF